MTIERRPFDLERDREKWLQWRREDVITGSNIAALWDKHPWISKFRLYQQARGAEFPEKPETSLMRRGRILENAADAAIKEERPDWILHKPGEYLRDTELRVGAT